MSKNIGKEGSRGERIKRHRNVQKANTFTTLLWKSQILRDKLGVTNIFGHDCVKVKPFRTGTHENA